MLNLLSKLACLEGLNLPPEELEDWYYKKKGTEPSYSDILKALAKTPSERQRLLRSYWEATDEEREEGIKLPTTAHHAIADLVRQGFVKVIVTTNFDRLMEDALRQAGINPMVLSTVEQVKGADPLPFIDCCLFKVHGDYLDPTIRNTPDELAQYPCEFNQLLDRIIDEYGLVVCGWSAEWDKALCDALFRCPSRRFTTYWASHREPGDAAVHLIKHRQAELISIVDADSFFSEFRDHVVTIEEFPAVNPLSVEMSVTRMKRYLAEDRYLIQLSDLIVRTVDSVLAQTTGDAFSIKHNGILDAEKLTKRVRSYTTASYILMEIAALGGYWLKESHLVMWEQALDRLLSRNPLLLTGSVTLINLQKLPGILLLYAVGLGAVAAGHLHCLNSLFQAKVNLKDNLGRSGHVLWGLFLNRQEIAWEKLEYEQIRQHTAFNDFVYLELKSSSARLGLDDQQYEYFFDKLELLMVLHRIRGDNPGSNYPLPVRCFYQQNCDQILKEINESLNDLSEDSPYVKCGILGGNTLECIDLVNQYKEFLDGGRYPWARNI